MSTTKFTPGPWRWSDEYETEGGVHTWSLLGKDGFGIASCDGKANSPQEVNPFDAHLIAAAPELYEALEAALEYIECHSMSPLGGMTMQVEIEKTCRAALAKARGEA